MTKNLISMMVLIAGLLLTGCSGEESPCPDSSCADYSTQAGAQAAFDADPECKKGLDADNDGVACEHLPGGGSSTGCATTSNCGCSGKNQNECGGPCCQWIVGTGCRCS